MHGAPRSPPALKALLQLLQGWATKGKAGELRKDRKPWKGRRSPTWEWGLGGFGVSCVLREQFWIGRAAKPSRSCCRAVISCSLSCCCGCSKLPQSPGCSPSQTHAVLQPTSVGFAFCKLRDRRPLLPCCARTRSDRGEWGHPHGRWGVETSAFSQGWPEGLESSALESLCGFREKHKCREPFTRRFSFKFTSFGEADIPQPRRAEDPAHRARNSPSSAALPGPAAAPVALLSLSRWLWGRRR